MSPPMTRPDHPRPEVVALAEALWNAGEHFISEVGIMHGSPTDTSVMIPAEILAEALPAPFAIVDMTAWRALADEARLVSQWHDAVDPMPDELRAELHDLGVKARAAIEGGRHAD